jgi:phosphonate transport system substrate-binding protein
MRTHPLHWLLLLITALSGQAIAEPDTIRFGVLSIAPPARIHTQWQPFANYLSKQLGQPVTIVVPRGFGKMKAAAAANQVDIFYVNSHVFYRLKQEDKAIGVAQMQNITGKLTSRSEVYVRADSGIESIGQLKGKRVAFVSPMGAGGYLAPRAYLHKSGVTDSKEIFTKNLSNSIHQVLLGDVEAGTMCGVNYRLMSQKVDTGELKIIAVSDEYPENLIAARADIEPALLNRIRDIITGMDKSSEGSEVLGQMRSMKIQRFLPYDPAYAAITEKLLEEAQLNP